MIVGKPKVTQLREFHSGAELSESAKDKHEREVREKDKQLILRLRERRWGINEVTLGKMNAAEAIFHDNFLIVPIYETVALTSITETIREESLKGDTVLEVNYGSISTPYNHNGYDEVFIGDQHVLGALYDPDIAGVRSASKKGVSGPRLVECDLRLMADLLAIDKFSE